MFSEYPITKIIKELKKSNLLPAIVFRSSRRQCDEDVKNLFKSQRLHLSEAEQEKLKSIVNETIERLNLNEDIIKSYSQYEMLIKTGAGAHHAGQLLLWRLVLEELMTKSVLRVMIATGTVAAGVDFPARSVVITAHSKRGSEGFHTLTSSELQQMSGRAGRRGKDKVGFCLSAPSQFCDARVIKKISESPPEPLVSVYFAAPSTVLNVLKYRSVEEMRYTVSKSLAAFFDEKKSKPIFEQAKKMKEELPEDRDSKKYKNALRDQKKKLKAAERLKLKQEKELNKTLNALKELNHVTEHGTLTEKGTWAAQLCTNLVLELAEAIDKELFTDLQDEELLSLVASIAGDSYREYLQSKKNPVKQKLFIEMQSYVDIVRKSYQSKNEVKVLPDAALTVLTWFETGDWLEFSNELKLSGLSQGDASRLISQTADHLNQIKRLEEHFPELAKQADRIRFQLLKSPISDQYYQ